MSTTPPPTRRLAIAITTAVSSITLAIGVTAASMLGWFQPARTAEATPPPATGTSPVILVPIESTTPAFSPAYAAELDTQVAMHEDDEHHGDHEHEDDDD